MNGFACSVGQFKRDYRTGKVFDDLQTTFEKQNIGGSRSELGAWGSTLQNLHTLLDNHPLPETVHLAFEWRFPLSFRRADLLMFGKGQDGKPNCALVELKQWNEAKKTKYDGVVRTFVGRTDRDVSHPSYQAWAYAKTLANATTAFDAATGYPLVWMTNARRSKMKELTDGFYGDYIRQAPLYFADEADKLAAFLKEKLGKGGGKAVFERFAKCRIRPSRKLIEELSSVMAGNDRFQLLDNQKPVFERLVKGIARKEKNKRVFVVSGAPGTGKTVVAARLLAKLNELGVSTTYVAANSSYRAIIKAKVGASRNKLGQELVTGSSVYLPLPKNAVECVIVDEAQRLKNGTARGYRGQNQIDDVIKAARNIVLFVDESQTIRPEDIGYLKNIEAAAKANKAKLFAGAEWNLATQFRCAGAKDYIDWMDGTLGLGPPKPYRQTDYTFAVVDDPKGFVKDMRKKVKAGMAARILAGKCWDWNARRQSLGQPLLNEVAVDEHDFALPWTSPHNAELWAISDWGQEQVASVHSVQGVEFDWCYVLVGKDLSFVDGKIVAVPEFNRDPVAKRGYKTDYAQFDRHIKQTYRILMTRGMRGTYVYFSDPALRDHMKKIVPTADL